jgi:uncharacterized membrane protein
MLVEAHVTINGSKSAIWSAITDIQNAPRIIKGIHSIEVVERPAHGLVGLRWRETRTLFGKPATAEKWITEAADEQFYKTRAADQGFVFLTTMSLSDTPGGVTLTSSHDSVPQGVVARIMSILMALFFKGVATKAIQQDLDDIKAAVERT